MSDLIGLQPGAYAAVWISFCIGSIASLLRFYSRARIVRNWGWDDWCAVVIFIVFIPQQYVLQSWLDLGCGRHWYQKCTYYSDYFFKVLFIEQVLIYFLHFSIKTAFCFFYLRLSPDRTFRKFVFLGMGFNASVFVTIVFIVFFQCVPFVRITEPLTHSTEGSCLNTLIPNVVPPALTISVDLYVLLLPVHTITTLQTSNGRKAGILCIVCFGLASLSLSAVRLPFVLQMTDALGSLSTTYDMSYNVAKMIILVALEMQFASIAVNLPALAGLGKYLLRRRRQGQRASGGGGGGSPSNNNEGSSGSSGYDLQKPVAKPISLEVFRKKKRGSRDGGPVPMGTVTRLERDVASLDSEEELCRRDERSSEIEAPDRYHYGARPQDGLNRIEVTTHVDVVTDPNSRAWPGSGYPDSYMVSPSRQGPARARY